ncbi:MAG: ABC transporter, ATP-binding protein [Parcubacteria group bacterium GW2011_GWA2_38_13]|nr:MAG: ABC transporter, ATP-binding protein [Parcubacteria group bacterium GW2011_GWA2_38_13]
MRDQDVYAVLARYGFNERSVKSEINVLSPGGRARLLIALFSVLNINVLVLDEPTNHLDIEAEEALEEALKQYSGTIILVSHDRYFLEKISIDLVYNLSEGTLSKVSEYREYARLAEEKAKRLFQLL